MVRIDIGLDQRDTFPVRIKVESERFFSRDFGKEQRQDDAKGE